jgi:hypothetical protein
MFQFQQRLKHIKISLKKWNKEVFGNIQEAKRDLEGKMEQVQREINQEGLDPERQQRESTLREEIEERDQQEEIMFNRNPGCFG